MCIQQHQDAAQQQQQQQQQQASRRRSRRKVHSSPVVGGGLFGENNATSSQLTRIGSCAFEATIPNQFVPPVSLASGRAAISVDNEVYDVCVSSGTLKKLQGWRSGSMTVGGPSVGD